MLCEIPCRELIAMMQTAADLYKDATLPLDYGVQPRALSAGPAPLEQRCMVAPLRSTRQRTYCSCGVAAIDFSVREADVWPDTQQVLDGWADHYGPSRNR